MPPKWVKGQPVIDALVQKLGLGKWLKHGDRLRKCIKQRGKIPAIFRKKDGHPVGEYASMFMTARYSCEKICTITSFRLDEHNSGAKRSIFNWLEDDGSGKKDGVTSSNDTDSNPEKGCPE